MLLEISESCGILLLEAELSRTEPNYELGVESFPRGIQSVSFPFHPVINLFSLADKAVTFYKKEYWRDVMKHFDKKENFDIQCSDRRIKNMVDKYYRKEPDWSGYYEESVAFLVEYGIRYLDTISEWIKIEYANHYSDASCDIPDYKTFLSLEQSMLDNQTEYQNKSVCVEGYIAWSGIDSVNIYPVPFRSEIEKKSAYTLSEFRDFHSLVLIGKQAEEMSYSLEDGTHIRVYGVTSPYKDWDNVPILVQRYEVLD